MNSINENVVLRQSLLDFDVFSSDKYLHDFNFMSATIGNMLPKLSFDEHEIIAKECAFTQILATKDEDNYALIKRTLKPTIDFSKKIIVTFHYSSYRLLNSFLISWSTPFKLVADNNYIQKQGAATVDSYHRIAKDFNVKAHDFEIINAEDRTVILKCIEAVKQGYSLVFYADGNSGVGGMTKDKGNMLKIPFLDSSMYVRKGIPTLASLLRVPITIATLHRNIFADDVTFNITENVAFPEDRKNELEILSCTKSIYKHLEEQLRLNPGMWEGWFYYHNFIDFEQSESKRENLINSSNSIFNHQYFGVGSLANSIFYILNKITFRLVPISKEFYTKLLIVIRENKIDEDLPVFKALYEEGILLKQQGLSM